jgi:hypothetical protein
LSRESEWLTRPLQNLVGTLDANKDGQFDREEFSALVRQVLDFSKNHKKTDMENQLEILGAQAADIAERRRAMDTKFITPWKWKRILSAGRSKYLDEISSVTIPVPPQQRLSPSSYTIMALEADLCVAKIDSFEQTWLRIVPKSRQQAFVKALSAARSAALPYTIFENQDDRFHISDLDSVTVSFQILANSDKAKSQDPFTTWKDRILALDNQRSDAAKLLNYIQAFTLSLDEISKSGIEASPQYFPKFQARWETDHLEGFSMLIEAKSGVWRESLRQEIRAIRKADALKVLESSAVAVIRETLDKRKEEFLKLEGQSWLGEVDFVTVKDWKTTKKPFKTGISVFLEQIEMQLTC